MSDLFTKFCRLTCDGGSECGTCPCATPLDCPMDTHPKFQDERRKAVRRMTALLRTTTPRPGESG